MPYTLFGTRGSGSAAIEIALAACKRRFERVTASSWEPQSAQRELTRLNPMRQIPTLVLPDGSVLSESAAILIHLGLAHPASGLLPKAAAARAQAGGAPARIAGFALCRARAGRGAPRSVG